MTPSNLILRFFDLIMPCNTEKQKPTIDLLLAQWKDFKIEATELGISLSGFLAIEKTQVKKSCLKQMISYCGTVNQYSTENILQITETIDTANYYKEEEGSLLNIMDSLFSIFSTKSPIIENQKRNSVAKLLKKDDALAKKFEELQFKHECICSEASNIFELT